MSVNVDRCFGCFQRNLVLTNWSGQFHSCHRVRHLYIYTYMYISSSSRGCNHTFSLGCFASISPLPFLSHPFPFVQKWPPQIQTKGPCEHCKLLNRVCSASTIAPSERSSIYTNRKSTMHFPVSPRWTPYVVPKPPKGGSKMQMGCFRFKIALRLKKVCYKVSLCENCQWQSYRAFIGLTIHAKMIGGGRPLKCKFYIK